MKLTEEERKILDYEKEEIDEDFLYEIEKYILDIYTNQEDYKKLEAMLNCLKRIILEVANKRGYHISEDISFNADELLKEIITIEDDLVGFEVEYYDNPEKMHKYFEILTKDMNWEDVESIKSAMAYTTDGFREFFVPYINDISRASNELLRELEEPEMEEPVIIVPVEDDVDDDDWDWDDEIFDSESQGFPDEWGNITVDDEEKEEEIDYLSEEKLTGYVKFINTVFVFIKYRNLGLDVTNELIELERERKLKEFYDDEEFSMMFDKIMEHDKKKSCYRFHGTQRLKAAETIMSQGLGMMREELDSTSYKEFTKDDVILYSRGFGGEIGREAVVIIDVPREENGSETNIVREKNSKEKINFDPSGLQGINGTVKYVVPPEYIVGYVDKVNKRIIFNPLYKDYVRFMVEEKNEEIETGYHRS